ncbi:hypothetical protein [Streptomyces sp. NPDC058694]|uniref:hypothetical protein n=1 Tax=Streptomyces sp. NPDC058694 TaxID=3346603 RepID=UPI00365276DA
MSAQPEETAMPVLPQPPMTRDALRATIRQLDLPRLAELVPPGPRPSKSGWRPRYNS